MNEELPDGTDNSDELMHQGQYNDYARPNVCTTAILTSCHHYELTFVNGSEVNEIVINGTKLTGSYTQE